MQLIMKLKQDISIGDNLRTLRKKAGLSQEEVAVKLQVLEQSISREIISQMECGKYSIRISVLLAMKEIYKVKSMDDFFDGLSL
jgi:Helix-turn-helix.